MSETDDVAGLIGEIEAEKTAHAPVDQTKEKISEPKAEGAESTPEPEDKTKTESQDQKQKEKPSDNKSEEKATGESPKGEPQQTSTPAEGDKKPSEEPSKTETENKTEADYSDWQKTLPPPPPDYQGKQPEFDQETGQITNMTPQEYSEYLQEMAKLSYRKEAHTNIVEGRALDIAEQVLPEMRSNQHLRSLVENARIASILSGTPIDSVQAALQVRDALGLSKEKILAAKTEGANNAKASITVQKQAALGTGSSQKPADTSEADKITELQKRIKRGDDEAFVELLGIWEDNGTLK